MKTDGIFTTQVLEVPFDSYNEPITLWAVGDIHYNSPGFDRDKFEEFKEEAQGDYMVGLGDYLDSISTSERKGLRTIGLHDSTIRKIEDRYREDVGSLAQELEGINVLAMCGGNHYYDFSSGITTDTMLCDKVNAVYTGVNCILRLILKPKSGNSSHKVDIVLHHGQGGGRTCGASINKVEKMANHFNADIVLQGHDHNRCVDYINRLEISNNNVLHNRPMLLARTGSFLKSYEEGIQSYAVDAAYAPADLGALKITITPKRSRANGEDKRWVDIKATL